MRIRELKRKYPWTTDQTTSRTKGLHLTGIIQSMDVAMRETQGEVDDATRMQFEKGYLWEVVLSQAFAEKCPVRIGEIMLDGITGSPDGLEYDKGEMIVAEYKCTAMSSDKPPLDNWKWMAQVKGYCKMLGAYKCRFHVLHHMDIMRKPEQCYRVWEFTFTQQELDENWESIINQAKVMQRGE